jgi:hypothetical protein
MQRRSCFALTLARGALKFKLEARLTKKIVHKKFFKNKHQTVPYGTLLSDIGLNSYQIPNTKYQNTHEFNLSTILTRLKQFLLKYKIAKKSPER